MAGDSDHDTLDLTNIAPSLISENDATTSEPRTPRSLSPYSVRTPNTSPGRISLTLHTGSPNSNITTTSPYSDCHSHHEEKQEIHTTLANTLPIPRLKISLNSTQVAGQRLSAHLLCAIHPTHFSPERALAAPCLQCVTKHLPCDATFPYCSRCARAGHADLCLVQRQRPYPDEEHARPSLFTLVHNPSQSAALWVQKLALEEELLEKIQMKWERRCWVLPRIRDRVRSVVGSELRGRTNLEAWHVLRGKCSVAEWEREWSMGVVERDDEKDKCEEKEDEMMAGSNQDGKVDM